MLIEFEAPSNFELKKLNSTYAGLRWTLNLNNLREISKQLNLENEYQNENDLIKNFNFELYLKERILNSSSSSSNEYSIRPRITIKSFRTISAIKLQVINKRTSSFSYLAKMSQRIRNKRNNLNSNLNLATFEYNLTNLIPNAQYTFELSARLFNLESHSSKSLRFTTLRKCFIYLFFSFINHLFIHFSKYSQITN
jgi:hypothetical protein